MKPWSVQSSKYGLLDGLVFNPVYQFGYDKPCITRVLQILLQVYGWHLPQRPIFVRWFEDAEAVRRPKLTKGDHSVLVQKPLETPSRNCQNMPDHFPKFPDFRACLDHCFNVDYWTPSRKQGICAALEVPNLRFSQSFFIEVSWRLPALGTSFHEQVGGCAAGLAFVLAWPFMQAFIQCFVGLCASSIVAMQLDLKWSNAEWKIGNVELWQICGV